MSTHRINEKITIIDAPINGRTGEQATYLVCGEKCAVIDPGPTSQASGVIEALKKMGTQSIGYILNTHIHLDHAGGSWMLLDEYKESILYCHPRGVPHMIDPSKLKAAAENLFGEEILEYGEIRGVDPERVVASKDKETIDLGSTKLKVVWTPGHSSHSQSYFEPDSRTVIVGDAVGKAIGLGDPIIPTSPPPHNPVQALESIELIRALNPQYLCIAHFGVYNDPAIHLDRISKRTKLWMREAIETVEEEKGYDDLLIKVLDVDHELEQQINGDKEAINSVKASLLGFYLYAKWIKKR